MKLRIRGNSLRLRLDRDEVARLAETGRVEDAVAFGPERRLVYAMVTGDALSARFGDGEITVTAPVQTVRTWAATEQVGIEGEQTLPEGGALRLLIEKDFACLQIRPGEDDARAFPNPSAQVCG